MWRALREIFKGTTFYYKQLNLFLFLVLLGAAVFIGVVYVPKYIAFRVPNGATASQLYQTNGPKTTKPTTFYDIAVTTEGKVVVNRQPVGGLLKFGHDADDFLFIMANEPSIFIDSIQVVVHLPYDVKDFTAIAPRIYAIHGVERSNYEIIDPKTIKFVAESIPPGSEVSVGFTFPKNYFSLTPADQLRSRLTGLSPENWFLIGSILPGLSLLFLFYLLILRTAARRRVRNRRINESPPASVPPALIGALYHGHIGKKEITATLFDLARRGFIAVHLNQGDEIVFAKGASLYSPNANMLRPYEVFLLHQIFGEEGFASHSQYIRTNLNNELFSSKIALTILNIYDATIAEGYFIKSPNVYYLKWRVVGLILFFLAVSALVYDAFTLPEPAFVLFLWLGMLLASLLIIKITPGLPRRTRTGDAVLKQWLGFRNYLISTAPLEDPVTSDFFHHLPYAIVMDCERDWIARWRDKPIQLPEWFTAEDSLFTAEEFSKSVVSVIEFLAKHLIASRPPDIA